MSEKKCWNTIKTIRFSKKYPLPNYTSLNTMVTLTKHFLYQCREFGVFSFFLLEWLILIRYCITFFFFFGGWNSIIQYYPLKRILLIWSFYGLQMCSLLFMITVWMREGKIRSSVATRYLYLNGIYYFNKNSWYYYLSQIGCGY